MTEPPESPQKSKEKTKAILTLPDAAALVGRELSDCFAMKDYGDTVVVVTVAGEKLTVAKNGKA